MASGGRVKKKLNVKTPAIPESKFDHSGVDDSIAEVKAFERMVSQKWPKNNHSNSVAGSQERCTQCERGGMRILIVRATKMLDINFAAKSA